MTPKTTSLALSKRLKALGSVQESDRYWLIDSPDPDTGKERSRLEYFGKDKPKDGDWHNFYSAYLPGELMERLPDRIEDPDLTATPYRFTFLKFSNEYSIDYINRFKRVLKLIKLREEHPAQALGKMYEYLLKNKLIKE